MRFRLKALGLHLLASFVVLTAILGLFYLAWYRWPGWYLADVVHVTAVLAGVDVVLGPLLTFIIASSAKPRRMLVRDIAVIATVQVCALTYGAVSLWNGRPLYYAYSEGVLSVVQAYDINPDELALARRLDTPLIPHWYSLPRWIWAPLPRDSIEQDKIVRSAIAGGDDVISMPRYYRPWESGLAELRTQLKAVEELKFFSANGKKRLEERMRAAGFDPDRSNALPLTGRGQPLLAVFDPASAQLKAIFKAN